MAPTFKVALIQMNPKASPLRSPSSSSKPIHPSPPLDPPANFSTASAHITRAAAEGASLAVLPEYHLTGWVPTDPAFAEHCAAANVESYLSKYQALASKLMINIVPGTIVTTTPDPSSSDPSASVLLNVSTFISYTGEILGSYNKKNLWHPERPHLTSTGKDEEHTIIETPLGPVGILVCWDLAFPEAFRALIRQGAKIVIVPTFWMATDCSPEGLKYNPDAEALFLQTALVARAYENTCCVIFVNAGGKAEDGYCGLSQVAMPLIGAVKGSFDGPEEGMRVVEVDMEILEIAEKNYKVREDIAKEDWHYGYSHAPAATS